jgi:hypothetical protein
MLWQIPPQWGNLSLLPPLSLYTVPSPSNKDLFNWFLLFDIICTANASFRVCECKPRHFNLNEGKKSRVKTLSYMLCVRINTCINDNIYNKITTNTILRVKASYNSLYKNALSAKLKCFFYFLHLLYWKSQLFSRSRA